eukprot:jgi/Orpsp1_1/1175668/evm.model.c7180000054762.1
MNYSNNYKNQFSKDNSYSQFHFVPPPKLPFQNNIPNNLRNDFTEDLNKTIYSSTQYNQKISQNSNNLCNNNLISNACFSDKQEEQNLISFLNVDINNFKIEKQKDENENVERKILKNSLLSSYFEKDKQWFEKWYDYKDKSQVDEINSFKKIKYLDVYNSFLEIYNNIKKMKAIKNQLEEIEFSCKSEESIISFNEKINNFNSLEYVTSNKIKKLNNINSINNWKFKKNKIKKRKVSLNNSNNNIFKELNSIHEISDYSAKEIDKECFFNIDNLIKKQKTEKNPDIIECREMMDMIQKLQKIRNIRKLKEKTKQNIINNNNNINIKDSKEINEKQNFSSIVEKNTSNKVFHIPNRNSSISIRKKKIYHISEKNKKLLKIKCEPYNNVYEYFNHSKLDIKSLIYIRKEWDRYIVKEGGSSIPPYFVKP